MCFLIAFEIFATVTGPKSVSRKTQIIPPIISHMKIL